MKERKRRITAFLACVAILLSAFSTAAAATSGGEVIFPQGSSSVEVYMGGKRVLEGKAALIDSVTYVAIREFSDLIEDTEVSWDAKTRTAVVTKGTKVITATEGDRYIYADGRCFYTVTPIRIISNKMFLPVRAIAKALGVEVTWDGTTRSVKLRDTGVMPLSGDRFYNADDLFWLSRIISAEAKGESLLGQIAVGNVVINRRNSRSYPNTIYGVIFDRKGGTQFSPVSFGTIYQKPTASSIIAAKICLEGYSISNEILFFMNPRIATNNWIAKNRTFEFRIGNHDFYS
ncbi:MAG: copper amine oxidase [Ruminococcaceae bacterium]|nr:copper amine oxidase [Oscillospiraceae bacterium]